MKVEWRWIPGYEGIYEVSDQGWIRSWVGPEPRLMNSFPNYSGYRVVTLHDGNGKRCQRRLHCLILEAFRGPRPPGHQGAHEDDDKNNNRLSNLAWKSIGDNTRDKQANGRIASGSGHGRYRDGRYVGRTRRYAPPKHIK